MLAIKEHNITLKKQLLRQQLDAHRHHLAPDILRRICPGCTCYRTNRAEGSPPCACYSPENVYYDAKSKQFSCRFRG